MITLTQQIQLLGYKVTSELPDGRFSRFDDGSAEIETLELLHSFARKLKPQTIFESGTYFGISSSYMGDALRENRMGHLITTEINQLNIDKAQELWGKLNLFQWITVQKISSLEYNPQDRRFQMLFLDSEPNIRLHEMVKFYPYLDDGGYAFIHDIPPDQCRGNVNIDHPNFPNWPIGEIPKEFDALIKERKLLPFYFPEARSLMGLYKPTKRDFI